ncbi:hypothetical protein ACSQ67_002136 [Phaseolus vulgaris]
MREKEETLGKEKGVQGLSIPAPTLKTLVEDANTCSNPKRHLVPLLVLQNPLPPAKLSRYVCCTFSAGDIAMERKQIN